MASIERLREVLRFEPETGDLVWRVATSSRVSVGRTAGSLRKNGYLQVRIDKKIYLCHRVAIAMTTGEWPQGEVDHIDGDKTNNRLANLRVVSRRTNAENKRCAQSNSLVGLLGVSKRGAGYAANIKSRGESKWLGVFPTPEQAAAAYIAAKRQIHAGCTL